MGANPRKHQKCKSKLLQFLQTHRKHCSYISTFSDYEIHYDKLDKWALIDIGVVKVESPYDFADESYKTVCSYIPSVIPISYEAKYQEPGTDAIVMGWGHLLLWRKESDTKNLNQKQLNYAPVIIYDKEKCKKHYEDYPNMGDVIDKYMICSMGGGNINDEGEAIKVNEDRHEGCRPPASDPNIDKSLSLKYVEEDPECSDGELSEEDRRRRNNYSNDSLSHDMGTMTNNKTVLKNISSNNGKSVSNKASLSNISTSSSNKTHKQTRRSGICQNDHGGPLVTWVGSHEILIGIASVFKVSQDSECQGPYLYTSTQCNGAFLDCVLERAEWPQSSSKNRSAGSRRALCKKDVNDPGQSTIERHISWLYHPHGAADNEVEKKADAVTVSKPKKYGISAPTTTAYPSNRGNPESLRYQQNGGYASNMAQNPPNDGYVADGGYPPNVGYPPNSGYPTNEGYQANNGYPPNYRNPQIGGYQPNEGYSANQGYNSNGEYPPPEYLPNEGYPPSDMAYQPNGGYPANMAPPSMSVANQMHGDNINNFPPNIRMPAEGQTFNNGLQNRYQPNDRNPQNSMTAENSMPVHSGMSPLLKRPQKPLYKTQN
ncbi:hypothetical protein B5X24_HaOG203906 [Helicoverpa armigera]|uniref:Uncharacterized protein n=1 Tax=Helicoverpa armigera TaxID=29058 RepID=A0A2W1BWI3_HELAM|nr:hypothetical protein B5X24_HaOG203906 [Helicoverpa armigera]